MWVSSIYPEGCLVSCALEQIDKKAANHQLSFLIESVMFECLATLSDTLSHLYLANNGRGATDIQMDTPLEIRYIFLSFTVFISFFVFKCKQVFAVRLP